MDMSFKDNELEASRLRGVWMAEFQTKQALDMIQSGMSMSDETLAAFQRNEQGRMFLTLLAIQMQTAQDFVGQSMEAFARVSAILNKHEKGLEDLTKAAQAPRILIQ